MDVTLRKIAEIKPYESNPRVNDAAVGAVAASIREFGWRQPVVVDAAGVIVCGHTRYKAALKLGLATVPVHVAKDLTPEQVKAYRLADNDTQDLAEWNMELLRREAAELAGKIDLAQFGLDAAALGLPPAEGLTDPDDVPAPPDEAMTRPGDLWVLGNHRPLCGDSSKAEDVDRLLDGARIHLLNTDPPYNVKVEPRSNNAIAAGLSSFTNKDAHRHHQGFDQARGLNRSRVQQTVGALDAQGHHHAAMRLAGPPGLLKNVDKKLRPKDRPLVNDFISDEDFKRMLLTWFGNIARVLEPGRCFYIWGGYANIANYPPALKGLRSVLLADRGVGEGGARPDAQGFYGRP